VKTQPASAAENEAMFDATVLPHQLVVQAARVAQVDHAIVVASQVTSLATVHLTAEVAEDSVENVKVEAVVAK
jgi:hypothetical protein